MPTCLLCRNEKTLVKSHIIPESFYDLSEPIKLLSGLPGAFPKRAPIGAYDRIVCAECEGKFGDCDNYAQSILNKGTLSPDWPSDPRHASLKMVPGIDYRLLKCFTNSLLWRASVSSHEVFSKVDVGPHEPRIRKLVIDMDPGDPSDFAALFAYFTDFTSGAMMQPIPRRLGGQESRNCYVLMINTFLLYVFVDSRPVPSALQPYILQREAPLILCGTPFRGTEFEAAAERVVRRNPDAF